MQSYTLFLHLSNAMEINKGMIWYLEEHYINDIISIEHCS